MDVYTFIFVLGVIGGATAVGLAWIGWWHIESRRPLHCYGCQCPGRESNPY